MTQEILELVRAKKAYDKANERLKKAKKMAEQKYPNGLSTESVLISYIQEHETSSYDWKKLEKAMEVDETLAKIGKMFIATSKVKDSYRYKFYV